MYLNAAQKQALMMLLACTQFLDRTIETDKLPKDVAAHIRRARTWARKASDAWLQQTDAPARRAIANMIHDLDIGVLVRADKERLQDFQQFLTHQEYAYRLAELAMEHQCKTCDGTPKAQCALYESLKHYDAPSWDERHPLCEYAGAGAIQEG